MLIFCDNDLTQHKDAKTLFFDGQADQNNIFIYVDPHFPRLKFKIEQANIFTVNYSFFSQLDLDVYNQNVEFKTKEYFIAITQNFYFESRYWKLKFWMKLMQKINKSLKNKFPSSKFLFIISSTYDYTDPASVEFINGPLTSVTQNYDIYQNLIRMIDMVIAKADVSLLYYYYRFSDFLFPRYRSQYSQYLFSENQLETVDVQRYNPQNLTPSKDYLNHSQYKFRVVKFRNAWFLF